MMGSIKQMKGENMTQQPGNPEAALSFFMALVLTIKKIEDEQPEPGFREVFMGLLDRHLEGAIRVDEFEGRDTSEDVEAMRKALSQVFISSDITDAMGKDNDDDGVGDP